MTMGSWGFHRGVVRLPTKNGTAANGVSRPLALTTRPSSCRAMIANTWAPSGTLPKSDSFTIFLLSSTTKQGPESRDKQTERFAGEISQFEMRNLTSRAAAFSVAIICPVVGDTMASFGIGLGLGCGSICVNSVFFFGVSTGGLVIAGSDEVELTGSAEVSGGAVSAELTDFGELVFATVAPPQATANTNVTGSNRRIVSPNQKL